MTAATTQIPGYIAGVWDIDASHSDISFSVRHMMVSKVKGRFGTFSGVITTGETLETSSVEVTIDANSIDTNQEQRDAHIRSADFVEPEAAPGWPVRPAAVRAGGGGLVVGGGLPAEGVPKPVALDVEIGGFGPDAFGGTRVGFSASITINRNDFGVDIAMPLDGGGVVVGEKVQIGLEIEAVLRTA